MSTSIFDAIAGDRFKSLFLVMMLRNANKHFGAVAREAIGVKILIMILMSANLVYH